MLSDPRDDTTACEARDNGGAGAGAGGAGEFRYPRVTSPVRYSTAKSRRGLRFRTFRITELRAGDVVVLRCSGGRRRGCAFRTRRYVAGGGQTTLSVVRAFKRRSLRRGASVEVRIVREAFVGKVQRLKVGRRQRITSTSLCQFVGETSPRTCG